MISTTRILAAAVFVGVTVAALAVFPGAPSADAGAAVATCTKAPDLRYDCTKVLAVNDHIQVNANGGVCHANVTAIGTISATLKSASISINHGVTNCAWQPGTNLAIGWRYTGTPTPTGNPVSVGGLAGLLEGEGVPASSSSGGGAGGDALALVLGISAVGLVAVAGLALRLKSKTGTDRDDR